MKMSHFWTQNGGSICPNQSISKKLLRNLVPIIQAYLYSKVRYQSINEIVTIKEYWKLIGREPFLAIITWEPDFSQVCSVCRMRMLQDHKNYRFTTNPNKTKDFIFLKSPKSHDFWLFLTIFDIIFFQKNPAVSHITKYGSLTPY